MGKSVKCLLHRLEDLSSLVPCVALAQPRGPALGTCEQKASQRALGAAGLPALEQ